MPCTRVARMKGTCGAVALEAVQMPAHLLNMHKALLLLHHRLGLALMYGAVGEEGGTS